MTGIPAPFILESPSGGGGGGGGGAGRVDLFEVSNRILFNYFRLKRYTAICVAGKTIVSAA